MAFRCDFCNGLTRSRDTYILRLTSYILVTLTSKLSTLNFRTHGPSTLLRAGGARIRYTFPMKTVAQNRRARFEYAISETLLAGMLLSGPEVKSCRAGHVDLSGAYVSFLGSAPVLKHLTIAPYRFALPDAFDPKRDRTLLLSKREIERLQSASGEKGVSIIPLEVQAGRHIKVLLGIGRGRKTIDKRQRIKEKDVEKRLRRGED